MATTPSSQQKQRKKLEPLALVASALASVTSMFIGSLFGDSGTLIGTAVGSIVSGSAVVVYENFATFTASRLKKTTGRLYAHDPDATRIIPSHQARKHRKTLIWAGGALTAGLCVVGCFAILTLTEAASGKTLHGVTTNTRDYGYTLGTTSTTPPSPAPAVVPPVSHSATTEPSQQWTPSTVPSPSVSPSAVPSAIPSTMAPSVIPSSANPVEPAGTQAPADPTGSAAP